MQPPVLPEIVVARVTQVGHRHGLSVLYVAGVFAVISAIFGDKLGALIGLLVAAAGGIEHHGSVLLRQRDPSGIAWLVSSQLFLFAAIAGYCGFRLMHIELPPVPPRWQSIIEISAANWGMTVREYLLLNYKLSFRALLVVSVFYQGGLAWYYLRQRGAVARAFAQDDAEV